MVKDELGIWQWELVLWQQSEAGGRKADLEWREEATCIKGMNEKSNRTR